MNSPQEEHVNVTEPHEMSDEAIEAERRDAHVKPGADKMPTPEEVAAADSAAADVDLDGVAAHEREMMELGANVKGEGEVPS